MSIKKPPKLKLKESTPEPEICMKKGISLTEDSYLI